MTNNINAGDIKEPNRDTYDVDAVYMQRSFWYMILVGFAAAAGA